METLREFTKAVEATILKIRQAETITDDLIAKTCKKYNMNETYIRKIAGWNVGGDFYK